MNDFVIIENTNINYILSSTPNNSNIEEYSTFLKNNNVKYLVNVGGSVYTDSFINENGIEYVKINYPDGTTPTPDIINNWKNICKDSIQNSKNIAIHCISGLGRAPTLICYSLIKYHNYSSIKSIEYIRKIRKNSFNSVQLKYILNLDREKNKTFCIIV